jgi:polyphosphate kinase
MTSPSSAARVKFFDRELSWIEFNMRVLAEAIDESNPILERLKFIGIVSNNFDEFFMVRVTGTADNPALLDEIYRKAFGVMRAQNQLFLNRIVPELRKHQIHRMKGPELNDRQKNFLKQLYTEEIFSLLTPIGLDRSRSLPVFTNLNLHLIFELKDILKTSEKRHVVVKSREIIPE